jgi:hypothetical protein
MSEPLIAAVAVLVLVAVGYVAIQTARTRKGRWVGASIAAGMVGLAALFGGVDPREAERLQQISEAEEEDEDDSSGDPP